MDNLTIVLGVVGAVLVGMLVFLTGQQDPLADLINTPTFAIADLEALGQYPDTTADVPQHYAIRLPANDLMVVLRPLNRSEVRTIQQQDIAPQLIDWQLLSTAIVTPAVEDIDVSEFPGDLVLFLKLKLNEISGFEIFS